MDSLLLFISTTLITSVYIRRQCRGALKAHDETTTTTTTLPDLLSLAIAGDLDSIQALMEDSGTAAQQLRTIINHQDHAGRNAAIHGAVFGGHLHVVQYLVVQCGANVNVRNELGCTPTWLAAGYNHVAILTFLLSSSCPTININDALNTPNTTGDTPLIGAASRGYIDICRLLLLREEEEAEHSTLPTSLKCTLNHNMDSALSVAMGNGFCSEELIRLLYDPGIVNQCNSKGVSPLLIACERDWLSVVRLLFELGDVDVNIQDTMGNSILGVAAFCGSSTVMEYFLDNTVSTRDDLQYLVNQPSPKTGCTPLWLSIRAGHVDCTRLLLQAGADATIVNHQQNISPMQIAKLHPRKEIIDLLMLHDST